MSEFEEAETGTIVERIRFGRFTELGHRILHQVKPPSAEPAGHSAGVRFPGPERGEGRLAALPEKKSWSARPMQALGLRAMEDEARAIVRPVGERADLAHGRRARARQEIVGDKVDRHEPSLILSESELEEYLGRRVRLVCFLW